MLIFRSVAIYHKSTHTYLSGIYNVVLISFNSVQNNSNSYFYVAVYFSIQHESSKGVNIVKKKKKIPRIHVQKLKDFTEFHNSMYKLQQFIAPTWLARNKLF